MTGSSSDGDEADNQPVGTVPGDTVAVTGGPASDSPVIGAPADDATATATPGATDDATAPGTTTGTTGSTGSTAHATGSTGAAVPGPSTGTGVPGPSAGAVVPRIGPATGGPSSDGFPYGLVATDLDGTLLRSDHTISPRTRDALAAACAAGAAHLVVTGRSVPWTRHVLDDLGYRGLAVCGQGAQLYHAGEHRLLTSITLDRQLAELALARIEAAIGPLLVAVSLDGIDGEVLIGPGYRVQGAPLPVRFVDEAAQLWEAPLSKIYLQHPELDDDSLARAARAAVGGLVSVMVSGEGIVELLPPGLSKATGLALAARRLAVPSARTIAFGDMPNDLPMFDWAARGVAMANAHPELLTVADEITASNDEDGIARVLERLLG